MSDLNELAEQDMQIKDRLNTVSLRINNKLVDDIDYFTFPTKFLEKTNIGKTDADYIKDRKKYLQSKQIMVK